MYDELDDIFDDEGVSGKHVISTIVVTLLALLALVAFFVISPALKSNTVRLLISIAPMLVVLLIAGMLAFTMKSKLRYIPFIITLISAFVIAVMLLSNAATYTMIRDKAYTIVPFRLPDTSSVTLPLVGGEGDDEYFEVTSSGVILLLPEDDTSNSSVSFNVGDLKIDAPSSFVDDPEDVSSLRNDSSAPNSTTSEVTSFSSVPEPSTNLLEEGEA